MTPDTWEEEFDAKYPRFEGRGAPFPLFKDTPNHNQIKQFIRTEIAAAEKRGRESAVRYIDASIVVPDSVKDDVLVTCYVGSWRKILEEARKGVKV